MVGKKDEPLNAAETALLERLLAWRREKPAKGRTSIFAARPQTLEEAKLRFRLAAQPAILFDLIAGRPKQSALVALGLGFVLGISPKARELIFNLIARYFKQAAL